MKFVTKPRYNIITPNEVYSGVNQLENYIEVTNMSLDEQLPQICKPPISPPKEITLQPKKAKNTDYNQTSG